MDQKDKDLGSLTVLMERFTEYRLPRAERLLEEVEAGETISDRDLKWLRRIVEEGRSTRDLVRRHPEYHEIVVRFIDLYGQIVGKALENEHAGGAA